MENDSREQSYFQNFLTIEGINNKAQFLEVAGSHNLMCSPFSRSKITKYSLICIRINRFVDLETSKKEESHSTTLFTFKKTNSVVNNIFKFKNRDTRKMVNFGKISMKSPVIEFIFCKVANITCDFMSKVTTHLCLPMNFVKKVTAVYFRPYLGNYSLLL